MNANTIKDIIKKMDIMRNKIKQLESQINNAPILKEKGIRYRKIRVND